MTGPELADEIEAWLARNPDVSRMHFSIVLRNQQSCYAAIRRTATIGHETVERARKLMAEKPDDVLRRRPIGRSKPKRAKAVRAELTNTRRARSIKATNRRQALDNIAAGRPAKSAAIRITQREIERQMREAAGFTADYVTAKSDGKITPIERARLTERAQRLGHSAGQVAA